MTRHESDRPGELIRTYAFDVLHFARWPDREDLDLDAADTDALLRYLATRGRRH